MEAIGQPLRETVRAKLAAGTPRPRFDLATMRRMMTEHGIDCLIASSPPNICFTTSARIPVAEIVFHRFHFAVFPADGDPCFIVSEPELWIAEEETWIKDIRAYHSILRPWSSGEAAFELSPAYGTLDTPMELLTQVLAEKGVEASRLGVETMWWPVDYLNKLGQLLPKASFLSCDGILKVLHRIKTPEEVALLAHANLASARALHFAYEASRIGDREVDLAAKISHYLVSEGLELRPWSMGSGPKRAGRGHPWASDRRLQPGDLIHADPKATYRGYHCDIVRMASVGEPSRDKLEIYEKIRSIHTATIESCRPGLSAHEIYHSCARLFEKHGLTMQLSMVGYSLGADLGHDPHVGDVTLMHGNHVSLSPGMVLDIGIAYDMPYARWHIEDAILVTENEPTLLSDYPTGGQYLYVID